MGLRPEEIRSRDFPIRRRGYEPAQVRAFLEEIADSVSEIQASRGEDAFQQAGREVAQVLRTAHEEAAKIRAAAAAEAGAIRSEAELHVAQARSDADDDREKAKRLLIRSRERAEELVADAESRASTIVTNAERQAHQRVATVIQEGRHRLDRMTREEQEAQQKLLNAQSELQAVIERITGPRPVIDLTAGSPRVDAASPSGAPHLVPVGSSGPEPETTEHHPSARPLEDAAGTGPSPGEPEPDPAHDVHDKVGSMVRRAVEEAVRHSSDKS